jgi:hypothetical protein
MLSFLRWLLNYDEISVAYKNVCLLEIITQLPQVELGDSRSHGWLLYNRRKKCEIDYILSTNFIFCALRKGHHYSVSVAEILGPAHGTPLLPRSISCKQLLYNNHCHHLLFMKMSHNSKICKSLSS